jgi:C-terminal processing protease CtpA/Prc
MVQSKWGREALCILAIVLFVSSAFAGDPLSRERDMMKNVCKQVSSELQSKFYDPDMKGLDWKALTQQAQDKIANAKSLGEMMTAVHSMVLKLGDSHTAFLPPGRNVRYKFGYGAKAFGDDYFVFALKKNGAAEKAGLKVGDRIVAVNKFNPTRRTYDDMMFYFRVIRNASAEDLTIQRGEDAPFVLHIDGEKRVEAIHKDDREDEALWDLIREFDKESVWHTRKFGDGVGYAQIRYFKFEGSDFMSGVVDMSEPSKAIILDFRSNGGGEENALKEFAGMFEDSEQVMANVVGRKKTEPLIIKPRRPHYKQPLFILVDSDTGSAAEMFARHFQLQKKAVIIGDKTAGAVTAARTYHQEMGVDSVVPYAVYIGTGKVVFPDGSVLEKVGVTPDVPCLPGARDIAEENDPCLLLAVKLARQAAGLKEDPNLKMVRASVDRE